MLCTLNLTVMCVNDFSVRLGKNYINTSNRKNKKTNPIEINPNVFQVHVTKDNLANKS